MEITCDIVGKLRQATTTNSFTTIRRTHHENRDTPTTRTGRPHHENLDATTTKQRAGRNPSVPARPRCSSMGYQ